MSDNHTPQSLPRRQRNRQTLVCRTCRSRKVRCDRGTPCGPCLKTKTHCVYGLLTPTARSPPVAAGHDVPLSTTTNTHVAIQPAPAPAETVTFNSVGTISHYLGDGASVVYDATSSQHPATPQSLPQDPFLVEEPCLAGRPKTFTEFHRTSDGTFSKTRLFGRSHWMHALGRFGPIIKLMQNPLFNSRLFRDPNSKNEIMTLIETCKVVSKSTKLHLHNEWLATKDLETLIPTRDVADVLIDAYFRTGENVYRILHVPSFRQEYEQYWVDPTSVDVAFLLKMLLAMSNGAIFYQGPDASHIIAQAKKWVFAGQHWLSQAPSEKSRLTLSGIQVHCLLILARQAHGMVGDLAWISVGSLLRAAQMMGLDRDPDYIPDMKPLQVELRRRIWLTIVEINLHLALDMGKRADMRVEDWDTKPPSNVDDEDIEKESRPTNANQDHVYTQTTMQRLLQQSLPVRLEACQVMNGIRAEPSYDVVLTLVAQLTKAAKKANAIPELTQIQRNLYDIHIRRYIYLLHAIFAPKALVDPRYYFSHKICFDTARTMASYPAGDSQEPGREPDFVLIKKRAQDFFKRVMIHSCVIILLELLRDIDEDVNEPLTSRKHRQDERAPLKLILKDALQLSVDRIAFAANNVKCHLFLSAICGQIEALESDTDPDVGAIEAAIESSRVCLQSMNVMPSPPSSIPDVRYIDGSRNLTEHAPTSPDLNITGDFNFDEFGLMDDVESFEPWSFLS